MGAWKEIVDYTVPSNTTSVTLNNFGTITKDDFIKVSVTSINAFNDNMNLFLTANNLSDHYIQILLGNGTSVVAFRDGFSEGGLIGQVSIGQTDKIFAYLKVSENGSLNTFSNYTRTLSNDIENRFCYNTSIDTLSTITSLTFNSNRTNGLGANSRIQIYRLTAEKVADITVTANTTRVDITGLDIKKGDEYLLVSDLTRGGSGDAFLNLFINNNTTENDYVAQRTFANGSTASASQTLRPDLVFGDPNGLAHTHIKITNTGTYTIQSYAIANNGTSNLILSNRYASSFATNITSINQLNIVSVNANQLGTNSRFQLYKLYEGGN